jgi:hypothetical protein
MARLKLRTVENERATRHADLFPPLQLSDAVLVRSLDRVRPLTERRRIRTRTALRRGSSGTRMRLVRVHEVAVLGTRDVLNESKVGGVSQSRERAERRNSGDGDPPPHCRFALLEGDRLHSNPLWNRN